jgi:hypothetical protein
MEELFVVFDTRSGPRDKLVGISTFPSVRKNFPILIPSSAVFQYLTRVPYRITVRKRPPLWDESSG